MLNAESTVQELDRTRMAEDKALKNAIAELETSQMMAAPLPWAHVDDGRIISKPLADAWEEAANMRDDDPRWETLDDPSVAFVTPSVDGTGQGERDAEFIVRACNAVPELLCEIRRLRRELALR